MIHCNHDLEVNKHAKEEMAAEIRTEQRAVLVEALVQRLMQPGGSCYPFAIYNFQEALANMNDLDVRILARKSLKVDAGDADIVMTAVLATLLVHVVREYWQKNAQAVAEKDVPL